MKKLQTVLLTCLLAIMQLQAAHFNNSLTYPSSSAEAKPVQSGGKGIKPNPIPNTALRLKTVVIDPGHGGHDPGCLGAAVQEKAIALSLSLSLAQRIRGAFPDVRVLLTREDDTFIPLHQRAALANRNNADLFISIHCNAMPGGSDTRGTETFVMGLHTASHNLDVAKRENASILLEENYEKNYGYDPNSPQGHILLSMFQNAYLEQSIQFAERVEHYFKHAAQRKSRGVKQAGFVVLKETTMPSVLIEAGFLSSRAEEAFLSTPEGQDSIVQAIFFAFSDYKAATEGRQYVAAAENSKARAPQATAPVAKPAPPAAPVAKPVSLKASTPAPQPQTPPAAVTNTAPPKQARIIPYQQSGAEVTPRGAEHAPPPPMTAKVPAAAPSTAAPAGIRFCIQLGAASSPINTQQKHWKNLEHLVEVVEENNLYKYQIRHTGSLDRAMSIRAQLQQQGFPDAFVVAYRGDARISIDEAKRALGL